MCFTHHSRPSHFCNGEPRISRNDEELEMAQAVYGIHILREFSSKYVRPKQRIDEKYINTVRPVQWLSFLAPAARFSGDVAHPSCSRPDNLGAQKSDRKSYPTQSQDSATAWSLSSNVVSRQPCQVISRTAVMTAGAAEQISADLSSKIVSNI